MTDERMDRLLRLMDADVLPDPAYAARLREQLRLRLATAQRRERSPWRRWIPRLAGVSSPAPLGTGRGRGLLVLAALVALLLALLAWLTLVGSFRQRPLAPGNGLVTFVEDGVLYTINADGTGLQARSPRINFVPPQWSPDGKRIAAEVGNDPNVTQWFIEVVDLQGGFQSITDGFPITLATGTLSWSADGRFLAFDSKVGDGTHVYIVPTVVTGPVAQVRDMTPQGAFADFPSWSPDGKLLAFRVSHTGQPDQLVVVSPTDPSHPRVLASAPASSPTMGGGITWAPASDQVAFDLRPKGGRAAVMIVGADGTNLREVNPASLPARWPQWSPDGVWIALASDRPDKDGEDLYLVHPDGSGLRKLADHVYPGVAWAPDGSKLLYEHRPPPGGRTGLQTLWVVRPNGEGAVQIYPKAPRTGPAMDSSFGWMTWEPLPPPSP